MLFWISSLYTPVSALSAGWIFSTITLFEKDILNFVLEESSWLSLNHLGLSSAEPDTDTSRAALSPDFTFKVSGKSTIAAGSRNYDERTGKDNLIL